MRPEKGNMLTKGCSGITKGSGWSEVKDSGVCDSLSLSLSLSLPLSLSVSLSLSIVCRICFVASDTPSGGNESEAVTMVCMDGMGKVYRSCYNIWSKG